MYIQSIQINNFKSIYDPLKLNFEDMAGLWKISGSVGAGKTTLGEAIIYGLFGTVTGKTNSDLLSWGRKHGIVEIWCTSKGRNIYIKRELNAYGQSPIYVEVDGEELIFTNKRDAQNQLEQEYYDTSKTTLELLCIISFNNFKSLATLNTADTKKFLDQVLGFEILTQYSKGCNEFQKESEKMVNEATMTMSNLNSQIEKLKEISTKAHIDGDIDDIKSKMEQARNQIKIYNNILQQAREQFNKDLKELTSNKANIIALGKNKAKEIAFIEKGVCPTCGAPIDQSQLEIKKQEKNILTQSYKEIVAQESKLQQELKEQEDKYNPLIEPFNKELMHLQILLIQLQEQAKHISINTGEIEALEKEVEECQDNINIYQKEVTEWSALYNILTIDVRSKILESFIPTLNKNILKYSQRLHQPYIITYDSNFKCNIKLCGMEKEISIASLSTGQLKTVDMVIILGVLGTIIGSNGINIIFLDELFSNLDLNLRNEMCSVLREFIKPNESMFIISHQTMDKYFFDGEIEMSLIQKNQYEKHSCLNINKYEKE